VLRWLEAGEGVDQMQRSFSPDLEAVNTTGAQN